MTGIEVALAGAGMTAGMQTAMAAVSLVTTLAGSAMSAMGTIAAGKTAAQQARMQAKQLDFQGDQLDARARWEQAKGRREADFEKRRKIAAISRARTVSAAGGFSAEDHSSSIAIRELERWGTFAELDKSANAKMQGQSGHLAADTKRFEAGLSRYEATAALSSSRSQAMASLVGGVGKGLGSFNPGFSSSTATTTGWGATTARAGSGPYLYNAG